MRALNAIGIPFDSSYNATHFGLDSGVSPGAPLFAPIKCEGVHEYPMTVFKDGFGQLRHTQLAACSFRELEGLLWAALEAGSESFVILWHNSELLNQAKNRPDWVVIRRFEKLCKLLDRHRGCFSVCGFQGLVPSVAATQPEPLSSTGLRAVGRLIKQIYRRVY